MRTPPYDIHQRRPATAVRACHSLSFSFSPIPPLALLPMSTGGRNPLSLWILSPSSSSSSSCSSFCLLGCCPISPIPVVGPTRSYLSYVVATSSDHVLYGHPSSSRLRWKVSSPSSALSASGRLLLPGASFFPSPSSPRELYRFLIRRLVYAVSALTRRFSTSPRPVDIGIGSVSALGLLVKGGLF